MKPCSKTHLSITLGGFDVVPDVDNDMATT
jgi:hypothetical protein